MPGVGSRPSDSIRDELLPRYGCGGDRAHKLKRSCITFAGWRDDREIAAEVLEALLPIGVHDALDALEQTQNRTDEKRRSLEVALQKTRFEASRIAWQYQATEPENRLVAAELEKRWNNALTHAGDLERRLEDATTSALELTPEQREQLLTLGDDLERWWDHPSSPMALKKRVLRTVFQEVSPIPPMSLPPSISSCTGLAVPTRN